MATQASTHIESPLASRRMLDQSFASSSRSSPIDLTNEDELTERRQSKKPRLDGDRDSTPIATLSSMSLSTPRSLERSTGAYVQQQANAVTTIPAFGDNTRQTPLSHSTFGPHFLGPSSSSAFFPNRRVQTASAQLPSVTGSNLSNGLPPRNSEVIDLTTSPSPPPSSSSHFSAGEQPAHAHSGMLDVPPKAAVLIGQLTVTALVLYPISYLQQGTPSLLPSENEWATVRLQYDAALKQRNPNAEETIHIMTPPMRSANGEVIPGENFGVVEQKVATVLGPMLGKGLIRLDAKVRRGVPNVSYYHSLLCSICGLKTGDSFLYSLYGC